MRALFRWSGSRRARRWTRCAIALASLLAAATTAQAADGPDFFFGPPHGWFAIRGGWLYPRAEGDLFTFVGDQLTIDRSDFRSGTLDLELGVVLTPLFAVEGGMDLSRRSIGSEYRRFIASNGQPIAPTTRLDQTGVFTGVRFTPLGRGRRVSRYAFIPSRLTPYAGAGLHVINFDFSQSGQFVDFADLSVFNDYFVSKGWTTGPYVRGGVDILVWRSLLVGFDARYTWLHSDLSRDFIGFDGIDLAGFRGTTGISLVF
jgi:hypothetical protein